MEIEIYSDVVCPWCWIGKRRLEQALASYEGETTLRYRPFQLDPSPVPEPVPLLDALGTKFGGRQRAEQMAAQVTRVGTEVGLTLDFDRALAANTFEAHRLIRYADETGRAPEVVEALHRAHFAEGVDIGSREALAGVAAAAGLDREAVRGHLDSPAGVAEVTADLSTAREIGVTSVPTFVLAGRYAVTGAQEPETLLNALNEVRSRQASTD
jgi:predicted DsbA family dithiol-disulfide isomerase